jgi:hypothetical protein
MGTAVDEVAMDPLEIHHGGARGRCARKDVSDRLGHSSIGIPGDM